MEPQSITGLTRRVAVGARARSTWLGALALLVVVSTAGCSGSEGEAKTSKSSASDAAAVATTTQSAPGSTQSGSTDSTSSETAAGGEGASTAGSTPASEADVPAQANAICAQRNRELQAVTPAGASLREIVRGASEEAAIERTALTKLERLTPPANVADDWRVILTKTKARLRATERLARVSRSSASIKQQMQLVNRPEVALLIAATRVGLKQCAAIAARSVR